MTADWLILEAIKYPAIATKRSRLIWNSMELRIVSFMTRSFPAPGH